VALDGDRTGARTIDFCSDDPDACMKIGELACERLGASSYIDERSGMLVAKWRCATFRFCGGASTDASIQLASGIGCEPTFLNAEVCGRGITPLMLVLDVATEKVLDPTGEAMPDVEARVVRTACDPAEALLASPLLVFDAIFVASQCGFSIDSALGEAARAVGSSDEDMAACMDLIRAVGKGKAVSSAEEYEMGDLISKVTGGQLYANANKTGG
jgi:hypothetical protein